VISQLPHGALHRDWELSTGFTRGNSRPVPTGRVHAVGKLHCGVFTFLILCTDFRGEGYPQKMVPEQEHSRVLCSGTMVDQHRRTDWARWWSYCNVAGMLSDWFSVPETAFTVTVKLPVMVWSTVSELVLAEFWLSPEYLAVMPWVPTANEETLSVATPFTGSTALPMAVGPS
jgi:hypothetical protein